jgi:SAM-dependent methyltransferase
VEPSDRNRRAFDEAHRTSENVLGNPGMPPRIRERLQGIAGSHVLHLLCGSGRETLQLVELGALVTGVDEDAAALERARHRGAGADVPWMHAEAHALPPELLLRHWDLVYLGAGSLQRLREPASWAAGVAAALRPGGVLLLHDAHPAAACLDAFDRWQGDYFDRVTLGDLVGAVATAGLDLRGVEEWPRRDGRVPDHLVLAAEKAQA